MGNFDELLSFLPQGSDVSASRRRILLAPLVAAVMLAMARTAAQAGRIDPTQTIIILPDAMKCVPSAADGHLELFKSTKRYDGAVGRTQHGYPPSAELPL
jgi:hypothetical protein